MEYLVTYNYCGNSNLEDFPTKAEAVQFIEENVNNQSYSEFKLWRRAKTEITIEI